MPRYILVNRRADKFTTQEKHASRAAISTVMAQLEGRSRIVADKNPADDLARRVVVLDADDAQVASLRATLPPDAILEPLIQRSLHYERPIELSTSIPMAADAFADAAASYTIKITGGGASLAGIQVIFYFQDSSGGQFRNIRAATNSEGLAKTNLPAGATVAFVEPIPYAGFWIMLREAPPSGDTIDCTPIVNAAAGGAGWWHDVMGIDVSDAQRGAGIKVGVIDTGCGPHPNLAHVTLAGVFVDQQTLPPDQATDVAEHGTHTTGLVGARPQNSGDYAGMAPGCDLFHARVFKSEERGDGPTNADLINAIDALSRDNQCDLINMSLGGGPPSQAEQDAIRDAAQRGTLCICSAGNDTGPIDFPGAYPECAAVSAVGLIGAAPPSTFSESNRPQDSSKLALQQLFLAAFSSFGPTLACAAPGVGIVSTVPDHLGLTGLYMEMDGTSMASPAACGALAVILSQDASYKALPRDISRAKAARTLLDQHCQSIGLAVKFEGRGLIRP